MSVVIAEIALLTSAESRRRLLEAASRRSTLTRSKSGAVLKADPTKVIFNPGVVTSAVNPNFVRVAETADTSAANVSATIRTMREPPLPELWKSFQASMRDLVNVVRDTQAALVTIKAAEAEAAIVPASESITPARAAPRSKREFGGTVTMQTSPLAAARGSGGASPKSPHVSSVAAFGKGVSRGARVTSSGDGSDDATSFTVSPLVASPTRAVATPASIPAARSAASGLDDALSQQNPLARSAARPAHVAGLSGYGGAASGAARRGASAPRRAAADEE